MPHDSLVFQQACHLPLPIARDLLGIEIVERGAERLALTQDRDPGKSGLETFEHEFLEQHTGVGFRHAPLVVVIGDVKRVRSRPRAALSACVAHHLACAADLIRAQSGMCRMMATSPARNGCPTATASSARSMRISARPERPLVEPSVPIGLPPTVISVPDGGSDPSPSTRMVRFRAAPRCCMRETTSWPTKQPFL